MRYPVGGRPTLSDAHDAATEAATMTGMRYRVYLAKLPAPYDTEHPWQFAPTAVPDGPHDPVRV